LLKGFRKYFLLKIGLIYWLYDILIVLYIDDTINENFQK
jgi:hypothetical protein